MRAAEAVGKPGKSVASKPGTIDRTLLKWGGCHMFLSFAVCKAPKRPGEGGSAASFDARASPLLVSLMNHMDISQFL